MATPYRTRDAETITLEHDLGGVHTTYTLTSTHLAVEWRQDGSSGRTEHPLREVSPDLAYYEGRSGAVGDLRTRAVIALSLAAVAHFSVLREHVPLLAGWLVLFGLHALWRAHRASGVSKWTAIRMRDGRELATIDHGGCDPEKLARMIEALRERVRVERSGLPDEAAGGAQR